MTLNDFINLNELLNDLRSEIDKDYARRIEATGWPESKTLWDEAQETLKTVDAVIELAGVYQLNSPLEDDPDPQTEVVPVDENGNETDDNHAAAYQAV